MATDSPTVIAQPTFQPVKYAGMSTTTILLMGLITFLALGGFVVIIISLVHSIHRA